MKPLATMALGVLIAAGLNAYPVLAQESVGALAEAPYEGSESTPSWHFSLSEARQIGEAIGIDWASAPFSVKQFRVGARGGARARKPGSANRRNPQRPHRYGQDRLGTPQREHTLLLRVGPHGGRRAVLYRTSRYFQALKKVLVWPLRRNAGLGKEPKRPQWPHQ